MKKLILLVCCIVCSLTINAQNTLEKTKERSVSLIKKEKIKAFETRIIADGKIPKDKFNALMDNFAAKDGFIDYEIVKDNLNENSTIFIIYHLEYVSKSTINKIFTASNIEASVESSKISKLYVY